MPENNVGVWWRKIMSEKNQGRKEVEVDTLMLGLSLSSKFEVGIACSRTK